MKNILILESKQNTGSLNRMYQAWFENIYELDVVAKITDVIDLTKEKRYQLAIIEPFDFLDTGDKKYQKLYIILSHLEEKNIPILYNTTLYSEYDLSINSDGLKKINKIFNYPIIEKFDFNNLEKAIIENIK